MSRTTIDFGIDLGTTNSAIAVLKGVSTEIIKNNTDADITPSAVSIDKKGVVQVGQRARGRIANPQQSKDVHQEFKRQMGTDHLYLFQSSGQQRRPEELSAEVLKSLRGDVQQKTGELIESSVITVPAAFELHQCDATRKAAQLAGFKESPLLQEPVAAALAYGFQTDQHKAYWLVYDFGGGTFDAAIIKAEEGAIHVVNHGGDNFLGGSDIDWAIVDQLLIPRLTAEFDLAEFTRGNRKWENAFAILKRSAEMAKIELSRSERVTLEDCRFSDSAGQEVDFECELTRHDIITVAEPYILNSVEICRRVLREKNLNKDSIEKLILVGGPTLAPYFRDTLSSALGIRLDFSADPLTVVARGAAVFAGSQKVKHLASVPVTVGEYQMELAKSFKPIGMDSAPMVGGKFVASAPQSFEGFTLELVNSKTHWRSGKITLRGDGVFMAHLHAEPGERNTFAVELFDAAGRKQKVTPDTLTYTIGAVVDEQPLINSMGIALANNEYAIFFEKGRGLPLKATHDFKTIEALRQGQTGNVLRVPVIEGDNIEKADRNRKIGELIITGTNIRKDLPAGSDIEVTMRISEDRIVNVTAYFPLLDEEFPAKIDMSRQAVDAVFLQNDFKLEMERFHDVKAKAESAEGHTAGELVQNVENSQLMVEVKEALAAASGDAGAAAKCEKRLLQLKVKLDEAADALEWPMLVKQANEWIGFLSKAVAQHGNDQQKQRAEVITRETEDGIRDGKSERLRKRIAQLSKLYYELITAQPGWWIYQFQQIEKEQTRISDQNRAARLLDQGRDCIAKNNFTGLQNVVRQLWDMLPKEVEEAARRGYQAGLVR